MSDHPQITILVQIDMHEQSLHNIIHITYALHAYMQVKRQEDIIACNHPFEDISLAVGDYPIIGMHFSY